MDEMAEIIGLIASIIYVVGFLWGVVKFILKHYKKKHYKKLKRQLEEAMERRLNDEYLTDKYAEEKFISPQIKTDAGDKDAINFMANWVTTSKGIPFFALLGGLGMGKTFLCRMFTRHLLKNIRENDKLPLPLYLDLKFLDLPQAKSIPPLEEAFEK